MDLCLKRTLALYLGVSLLDHGRFVVGLMSASMGFGHSKEVMNDFRKTVFSSYAMLL